MNIQSIIESIFEKSKKNQQVDYSELHEFCKTSLLDDDDYAYICELAISNNINKALKLDEFKNKIIENVLKNLEDWFFSGFIKEIYLSPFFIYDRGYINISRFLILVILHRRWKVFYKVFMTLSNYNSLHLLFGPINAIEKAIKIDKDTIRGELAKSFYSCSLLTHYFNIKPKDLAEYKYFNIYSYKQNQSDKEIRSIYEAVRKYLTTSRLSVESSNFYIVAKIVERKLVSSPLSDYSICSLQYYKIIEIEIKKLLLEPSLENINVRNIINDLILPLRLNKNLKEASFLKVLTLEKLHHLFKLYLDSFSDKSIKLSNDTKQMFLKLFDIIPQPSEIAFILNITHNNALQTFRNPPAHTSPLDHDKSIASENIMLTFLDMFLGNGKFCDFSIIESFITNKNELVRANDISIFYSRDSLK